MGLIDLISDLNNRRQVRAHARHCRSNGVTDEMRDHALAVVCEIAKSLSADDDPSRQYLQAGAASRLEARMPGLDPATILLLVQLVVLIYQSLKAVGFLSGDGLASASPTTINEHFGGL